MNTQSRHIRSQAAFTLLEVSVVLIIIGLIIGGVLVGRSVIESSQLQSVITDVTKYTEAAKLFKEKYGYLPGDFPNATQYWGTDPVGCPDTGPWSSTPQTATCNGDGNGIIDGPSSGVASTASYFETWRAWQHLSDAGFIEGAFSGLPSYACWEMALIGINVPVSKVPGGAYEWYNNVPNGDDPYVAGNFYTGMKSYTQYLLVGGADPVDCVGVVEPIFSAAGARSIDLKVDDGMPSTGKWIAGNATNTCEDFNTPPNYISGIVSWIPNYRSDAGFSCPMAGEIDW